MTSTWELRVRRAFQASLVDKVPRDHLQPDSEFRRRRIVVAIVLIAGATLLGISLHVKPGSGAFYPLTFGLAAVWTVGGFLSGPLHVGYLPFRGSLRLPLVTPFVLGLIAGVIFIGGALVVRQVPYLDDFVRNVLDHAKFGSLPIITVVTLVNGVAEEIFFRGGLFAAIGREHPVLISTVIYTLATVATLNLMLVFAAGTLGLILALERRSSGGILAPIITHITWSTIMLFALPPLFN